MFDADEDPPKGENGLCDGVDEPKENPVLDPNEVAGEENENGEDEEGVVPKLNPWPDGDVVFVDNGPKSEEVDTVGNVDGRPKGEEDDDDDGVVEE